MKKKLLTFAVFLLLSINTFACETYYSSQNIIKIKCDCDKTSFKGYYKTSISHKYHCGKIKTIFFKKWVNLNSKYSCSIKTNNKKKHYTYFNKNYE